MTFLLSIQIALVLTLLLLCIIRARGYVTYLVLTLTALAQVLLGYILLDRSAGTNIALVVILGVFMFCLGFVVMSEYTPIKRMLPTPKHTMNFKRARVDVILAAMILGISFYHLYALGFPAFRDDVETRRFDFEASGFFGIPSRLFLMVLPLLMIYVTQKARVLKSRWYTSFSILLWVVFALLQLISGFKGALVMTLNIFLFSMAIIGVPVRITGLLRARYILLATLMVGAAVFFSFQYRSRNVDNIGEAIFYLGQRVTSEAAEPGYRLLRSPASLSSDEGSLLANDARYFLYRYTGRDELNLRRFPSDQIVSSAISGTPLRKENFLVSVTIGLFPMLLVDFGTSVALFLMLTLGAAAAIVIYWARRLLLRRQYMTCALLSYVLYVLYVVLLNGNIVYWVINTTASLVLFVLLFAVSYHGVVLHRMLIAWLTYQKGFPRENKLRS